MRTVIQNSIADLGGLLTEGVLVLFILLCIVLDISLAVSLKKKIIQRAALLLCPVLCYTLYDASKQTAGVFLFAHFYAAPWMISIKAVLLAGYALLLFAMPWRGKASLYGLWVCLLTTLLLGSALMVSAHSMLGIYLSMETAATATYLLVPLYLRKKAYKVGIKYMLYGIFSMGVTLYGFSLWYALSGHLHFFTEEASVLLEQQPAWTTGLVMCMILTALFFKLSLFPMHLWTPAVYAHMPLPALSFLSTLSKGAALVVLWKVSQVFQMHSLYPHVLGTLMMLSILVGSLGALQQKNMRGLLAYSTIAYAGFLTLPLLALPYVESPLVLSVIFFGWIVYSLAYYALLFITDTTDQYGIKCFTDFRRLRKHHTVLKITLLIALLALIGLPPTAGLTAKFLLISAVAQAFSHTQEMWYLVVIIVALMGSLLSLFFYARPIYHLFIQKEGKKSTIAIVANKKTTFILILLSLGMVFFFVFPNVLVHLITK